MEQQLAPSSLTLAIAKQDRLKASIIKYLNSKGFALEENDDTGVLIDTKRNIPNIRVEFVRATDALLLMEKGVVDLAMIGSDIATENTSGDNPAFQKLDMKFDLRVAGCSFELAVPDDAIQNFKTPADVNGLRIATSYPNLLKAWLQENKIEAAEILVRAGGVESSIRMGLVDVVADLVDTGSTLRKNNLTSAFQITRTSAACYAGQGERSVLTSMLLNEFVREIKARSPVFLLPVIQKRECAVA